MAGCRMPHAVSRPSDDAGFTFETFHALAEVRQRLNAMPVAGVARKQGNDTPCLGLGCQGAHNEVVVTACQFVDLGGLGSPQAKAETEPQVPQEVIIAMVKKRSDLAIGERANLIDPCPVGFFRSDVLGGVALFLAPTVKDVDLDDEGWVLFQLLAGHQQRFCGVL